MSQVKLMNSENEEMTPMVRAERAKPIVTGKSQKEEHDELVRTLDRMIAISRSAHYQRGGSRRAMEYDPPSLVDEVVQIHCTPIGVETSMPPTGWDALAQDWQRVGSYMRSVMPSVVKPD